MKRIFAIILAGALVFSLASCKDKKTNEDQKDTNFVVDSNQQKDDEKKTDKIYQDVDLALVAESLYDSIEEYDPEYFATTVLDKENFEYSAFIPYEDEFEAVINESMISIDPHCIVLVKCGSAEKAAEVAKAMKENCNPAKWICVEADIVEGVSNNNIAMLLMTTSVDGMSEKILENFNNLNSEKIASLKSENKSESENPTDGDTSDDDSTNSDKTEKDNKDNKDNDNNKDNIGNVVIELPENKTDVPASGTENSGKENTDSKDDKKDEPSITVPTVPEEKDEKNDEKDNNDAPEDNSSQEDAGLEELYKIAENLYSGIPEDDLPFMGVRELGEEDFEYVAFAPYKSTYLAVESAPVIGSIPHSVVVVKTASSEEAKSLATTMKENCNPRKWVCVEASCVKSASKGNYAILVMVGVDFYDENMEIDEIERQIQTRSEERANIIINNFNSNAK